MNKRKKLVPLPKPPKKPKPSRFRKVALWVICTGIPFAFSAYVGIVGYWPKINIEALEALDKSDAMTAPFEISNAGFFTLKNLDFEWKPRFLENIQRNSQITGFGTFITPQRVSLLRPEERGPVMFPTQFLGASVDRADLIVAVRYQPRWLPLRFYQEFRFVTKTAKDGEIRWYRRPLD